MMLLSAVLLSSATGVLGKVLTSVYLTTFPAGGAHCPTTAWQVVDGDELASAGIIDRCIDSVESGTEVTVHLGQFGEVTDSSLFCSGRDSSNRAILGANVEALGYAAVTDFLEVPPSSMSYSGPLTLSANAKEGCVSVDGWFAEEADSSCGASQYVNQYVYNQANGQYQIFVMSPFYRWAGMVEVGGTDCVTEMVKVEALNLSIRTIYDGRRQTVSPISSGWTNADLTGDPECTPTVCTINDPITADKIDACLTSVPDHCRYLITTTVSGTTTHPDLTCEDAPVADLRDAVGGEVLSGKVTATGTVTLTLVGTHLPGCRVDIRGLPVHTCVVPESDSSIIATNQVISQDQTVTFDLPDPAISPSVHVQPSEGETCDVQFIRKIQYDSAETVQEFEGQVTNSGPLTKSFGDFREITGASYCAACSAESIEGVDYPASIATCLFAVTERCVYLWSLQVSGSDSTGACTSVGPSAARLSALQPVLGHWATVTGALGQPQGTMRFVLDTPLENKCLWDVYLQHDDPHGSCEELAQQSPADWTNLGVTLHGVRGSRTLTMDLGSTNLENVRDWDTYIILVPQTPATCSQRFVNMVYSVSGIEGGTGIYETIRPPGGSDNSDYASPLMLPTLSVLAAGTMILA